jgi:hypothetical protein
MYTEHMQGYELWDTESGNLLDDFDTELEALHTVRDLLALNKLDRAESLTLFRVDAQGHSTALAAGAELAKMARRVNERHVPRSA